MSLVNKLCFSGRRPCVEPIRCLVESYGVCVCVIERDQLLQSLNTRTFLEYLEESRLKELHKMTVHFLI